MAQVDAAEEVFAGVEKRFGFVPNVIREMAKSPAVARVYLGGQEALAAASLSPREQQAVQLAISAYNGCDYCRAAHGMGARMAGVAPEDVQAIERGGLPQEPRLRSLVSTTLLILEKRGGLREAEIRGIESQGLDRAQIYEVIALIGLKTISNYVNHIAHTELDPAFRARG